MSQPIYKSKQEAILIETLSKSQLISRDQLLEIKKLYDETVPYHNFLHALNVANRVLILPRDQFSITEIQSLFLAALFHDAGHSGIVSNLDEFRSLDMAFEGIIGFEEKYDTLTVDLSIVRKAIVGTVFKNRASNTNKYAVLMADLDISIIGMSFPEFLYYADFPFSIECGKQLNEWLSDKSYFKFLMGVDKNVFRNETMRNIFPLYLKNIKKYLNINTQDLQKIYDYWKDNDITYDQFKQFYNSHLK